MIRRRSRHQSNYRLIYSWEKMNIFLNGICANPRYCQSSDCSGRRHPCCRGVPKRAWTSGMEIWNWRLVSRCSSACSRMGWTLIVSVILFCCCNWFSFLLWTWKFSTYIRNCDPCWPMIQGRGTVHCCNDPPVTDVPWLFVRCALLFFLDQSNSFSKKLLRDAHHLNHTPVTL